MKVDMIILHAHHIQFMTIGKTFHLNNHRKEICVAIMWINKYDKINILILCTISAFSRNKKQRQNGRGKLNHF